MTFGLRIASIIPEGRGMREKHLTRRWNDIFSIVILIVAVVFITLVLTGVVEGGSKGFTALVVIGGVG